MRLELSRRTDLAMRALRALAEKGGRIKRSELAGIAGTTPDFLARVMAPLVARGWVVSEVGRSGGYQAAAGIGGVSVLDLIEAMEGAPDDGRCVLRRGPCSVGGPCALHDAWTRARGALMTELAATPVTERG